MSFGHISLSQLWGKGAAYIHLHLTDGGNAAPYIIAETTVQEMEMFAMASVLCPSCGARIADSVYLCPQCGAEVAMYVEDLRVGRLFLLMIAGSVLGGIIAFTGAMFYVGIADTYRLVTGAWGFTILVVLGLGWLAEAWARWQLEATEEAVLHDEKEEHHG